MTARSELVALTSCQSNGHRSVKKLRQEIKARLRSLATGFFTSVCRNLVVAEGDKYFTDADGRFFDSRQLERRQRRERIATRRERRPMPQRYVASRGRGTYSSGVRNKGISGSGSPTATGSRNTSMHGEPT